jgi:hypothetical protein
MRRPIFWLPCWLPAWGPGKTITKISKFSYFPLMTAIGIEQVVSTRLSAINTILQHMRRGQGAFGHLHQRGTGRGPGGRGLGHLRICGKAPGKVKFPKGAMVAGIIRRTRSSFPPATALSRPMTASSFLPFAPPSRRSKNFWRSSWSFLMRWRLHASNMVGILTAALGRPCWWPCRWSCRYREGSYPALLLSMASPWPGRGFFSGLSKSRAEIISQREGMAIVTLGWTFVGVFRRPAVLPLRSIFPAVVDAIFESVSGFTTTGASVLTDIEALDQGLLLWRSFIQWLGGMGIIVLSVAILPFLGVGGMQLYKAEVPSPVPDKLKPRIRDTAMILWKVYALFTGRGDSAHARRDELFDALNAMPSPPCPPAGFPPKMPRSPTSTAFTSIVIIAFHAPGRHQLFPALPVDAGQSRWPSGGIRNAGFSWVRCWSWAAGQFDIYGAVYASLGEALRYGSFFRSCPSSPPPGTPRPITNCGRP